MKSRKKLVDLIYLDSQRLEFDLKKDYRTRIDTWMEWVNSMLDKVVDEEIYVEEQSEYFMANSFLRSFLVKRLDWVLESVENTDLRNKYLLTLPPFNQSGNIKQFLLHFFQFKNSPKHKAIRFNFLNHSEREVRILWDVYKLVKTLQTINVIKRHASGKNPFPSIFPNNYIIQLLGSLKRALSLLIKICLKSEYHRGILNNFPTHCFKPESILERKESGDFLVNNVVLEKFDYRNYFFHIYFRSNLKAIHKGKALTFKYNYLDYEIIRQEFLTHWINKKLTGNQRKEDIFDHYTIGRKTFNQVIQKTPELEITLLKRLPKNVFDDLMAEINESLDEKRDQSPIDPMSEKFGEFARQFVLFDKAKKLAKKSIKAIRNYLAKREKPKPKKIKKVVKKQEASGTDNGNAESFFESEFTVQVLSEEEIEYPFFCKLNAEFSKQITLLQTKMPPDILTSFQKKISNFLLNADEGDLIKRRTPRHEWSASFLINEDWEGMESKHLLILGAEVKNVQLSMGYGSGTEGEFELKCYYVYGSEETQTEMGTPTETRDINGKPYHIYYFARPAVVEKAMKLIKEVIEEPGDVE